MVLLSITYQHLSARINRKLEPIGLNMTQLSLLNHLEHQAAQAETISSLCAAMEMNQPAVTKAIKAMTSKGWVLKQTDKEDARISHVFISATGLDKLTAARQAVLPVITQAYQQLSDEELAGFADLLQKLRNGLIAPNTS